MSVPGLNFNQSNLKVWEGDFEPAFVFLFLQPFQGVPKDHDRTKQGVHI